MPAKPVSTSRAPAPRGFYSQGVRAESFLFVSGQLPIDQDGNLSGLTPADQTRTAMGHVAAILEAAGGALSNLVQVTIYVSGIEHWPEVNAAYQEILAGVPFPPARAVVPVKELHYGALVEIQAIASLPNEPAG